MPNQIYIDGVNYTKWASGLDDLTESYSKRDDGTIELGQTSQVVMDGEGFDYWRSVFIEDSCNSIDREYEVRIWISSCSQSQYYVLKAQGVSIDDVNCKVKMNLNVKNDNDEKIDILRKSYFWDKKEGFIDYALGLGRVTKMLYVKDATAISRSMIFIYLTYIAPLVNFVQLLISVIDFLVPGKLSFIVEEVENDIIGAGEFSTLTYPKDILNYWCNKAGLTFSSSILNEAPYDQMALFSQQYEKGIELDKCNTTHFDENNAPNLNPIELLSILSPVFNARWEIIDGVLYFERHDFFDSKKETVLNLEREVRRQNFTQDWSYNYDNASSFSTFIIEWANDSIDTQGNRAKELYYHVEEWNENRVHKNRKGQKRPEISFAPARFTNDKWLTDIMSFAWWDSGSFFSTGSTQFTHSLVMSFQTAQQFKLIVIDKTPVENFNGCNFYSAKKRFIRPPRPTTKKFADPVGEYEYNSDMFGKTLYDRFHYIDDPDLNTIRPVEIQSLTWRPEDFCTAVNFVREHKLNTKITSKLGDGHIGSFTIDYGKCTITLQDIKFRCQST